MIFRKNKIAAIALCGVFAAALTTPFSASLSASAEEDVTTYAEQVAEADGVFDTLPVVGASTNVSPFQVTLQPERTFVSTDELAQGDVHIRTNVYFHGDNSINPRAFLLTYHASDSEHVYFDNSLDVLNATKDYRDCTYSGGSYTSNRPDFCLGSLSVNKKGQTIFTPFGSSVLGSVVYERMNGGNVVFSDGNGGAYFTLSCHKLVDGVDTIISEKVEIPASQMQVHADGSASFDYLYYDQNDPNYAQKTATIDLPHYDTTLSKGTPYNGYHDSCYWTSDPRETPSFFGYTDEFPCYAFDIVLRQGTPAGSYDVQLNDSCRISIGSALIPLQLMNTTITVGTASGTITQDSTSPYYCFFAENDKEIRLNQGSGELISTVTSADGTTATQDVTDAVTCGQSPAELYAQQSGGAYVNPVPFTLNTQPLKNTDGTDYTKTLLIGKKGDTNLDGKVDVDDAVLILQYYAKKAAGLEPTLLEQATNEEEILSYFLSDIDTCSQNQGTDGGELSVEDAVQILTYYAQAAAGNHPVWSNR